MFPKVDLGALNVYDLRPANTNFDAGLKVDFASASNNTFKGNTTYNLSHPRVNDSAGVSGESPNGKVLPYLLA